MNFSTLYKKTSTGAIQYWTIFVLENTWGTAEIWTKYGQVGGKEQETVDTISEGKNVGKKNGTTPLEQAIAEAGAKWEKQQKKGYVNSIEMAEAGGLSSLIEGGIVPMLAHKYSEQGHKIKYPSYAQAKLDGIRCIAILMDGVCTLWSRTRKPITGVPHISRAIEKAFRSRGNVILDGELYNHHFKANFEKIVSFVRQENPAEGHEIVEFHIYDIVNEEPNGSRIKTLAELFLSVEKESPLKLVPSAVIDDEGDISYYFNRCRDEGYEGAMIRNADGQYVNKRSYDLQKVKEFDDSEFPIAGVKEGRGKLAGHAIFICKLDTTGATFDVKLRGDTEYLKKLWKNHSLWEGKLLTVQYQGFTSYGVPRFPVGVAIRDYE